MAIVDAATRELVWTEAQRLWLERSGSAHTRRVYRRALEDWKGFLATLERPLWEAIAEDARQWMAQMREQGLSPATIRQRLAAISSLYSFAMSFAPQASGDDQQPLCTHNPMELVTRPDIATGNAPYLNADEVRALLRAIPKRSLRGKRDFAMITFFLFSGWRASEVCSLRWDDFLEDAGRVYVRRRVWGEEQWDELPPVVWKALKMYQEAQDESIEG